MKTEKITYQEVEIGDRVILNTKDGIREVEIDLVLHDPGIVTLGWEKDYAAVFTSYLTLERVISDKPS